MENYYPGKLLKSWKTIRPYHGKLLIGIQNSLHAPHVVDPAGRSLKIDGGAHVTRETIQGFINYILYTSDALVSRRLRAASEQVLRPGRRAPVPRLGPVLQALRVVRNHAAGQSPGLELRCGLGLQLRRGLGLGV